MFRLVAKWRWMRTTGVETAGRRVGGSSVPLMPESGTHLTVFVPLGTRLALKNGSAREEGHPYACNPDNAGARAGPARSGAGPCAVPELLLRQLLLPTDLRVSVRAARLRQFLLPAELRVSVRLLAVYLVR